MDRTRITHGIYGLALSGLLCLLVAACSSGSSSGTSSAGSSSTVSKSAPSTHSSQNSAAAGNSSASTGSSSTNSGTKSTTDISSSAYLIKSLSVALSVKDTRSAATEIQTWISNVDTRSTTAGVNYTQEGKNLYAITMTFSVQAARYPQVYAYLRDYKGYEAQLSGFQESVQDVSNDYVDTQSRIKTYQVERDRLLTLLKQAQNTTDMVTIEQRLSDVEEELETAESHLKQLDNQTTFYNVTLQLSPITLATPPAQPDQPWSIGQTFAGAWGAVTSLGKVLLTVLIWLLTFGIYIIPIALIAWFTRRWWLHRDPSYRHPVKSTPIP